MWWLKCVVETDGFDASFHCIDNTARTTLHLQQLPYALKKGLVHAVGRWNFSCCIQHSKTVCWNAIDHSQHYCKKHSHRPSSMQSWVSEFSKGCWLTMWEILMYPDDFSNESFRNMYFPFPHAILKAIHAGGCLVLVHEITKVEQN